MFPNILILCFFRMFLSILNCYFCWEILLKLTLMQLFSAQMPGSEDIACHEIPLPPKQTNKQTEKKQRKQSKLFFISLWIPSEAYNLQV